MRKLILALLVISFPNCGDTNIYNLTLDECICKQDKEKIVISCGVNEIFVINHAKCEKKL